MATRFRFPSSGTSPISPALQTYTHTPTTRRFFLRTVDDANSALSTVTEAPDAADHIAAGDLFIAQFISDPLAEQTFTSGDAFKLALQTLEANAGNNLFLQIWMGIYTGSGGTLQSTIRSKVLDGTEVATTLTNRIFNSTLSATYACLKGERLVVELSLSGTPTATGGVQGHNGSIRLGSNGAGGDLAENDTETGTTFNPWIEFANTIVFQAEPSIMDASTPKSFSRFTKPDLVSFSVG